MSGIGVAHVDNVSKVCALGSPDCWPCARDSDGRVRGRGGRRAGACVNVAAVAEGACFYSQEMRQKRPPFELKYVTVHSP